VSPRANTRLYVAGTARARQRLARLEARGERASGAIDAQVRRIVADVRRRGDRALIDWTRRLDGVRLTPARIAVPADDLAAAFRDLPRAVRSDLTLAASRIRTFHTRQVERSWTYHDPSGARLGQAPGAW